MNAIEGIKKVIIRPKDKELEKELREGREDGLERFEEVLKKASKTRQKHPQPKVN